MENKEIYNDAIASYYNLPYLMHHGIRGQKWGVRRYQNPDGTRTEAGKRRDEKRARIESAKNDVKTAKQDYKNTKNHIFWVSDEKSAAYEKITDARARLAGAKRSTPEKAARAERRYFENQFMKRGMPGNILRNQSNFLYDQIKDTRGKEYADKVLTNAKKRTAVKKITATAAYVAGPIIVNSILNGVASGKIRAPRIPHNSNKIEVLDTAGRTIHRYKGNIRETVESTALVRR